MPDKRLLLAREGARHVVARRLGHRDPMVTATIYAHVTQDQEENASLIFAKAVEYDRVLAKLNRDSIASARKRKLTLKLSAL